MISIGNEMDADDIVAEIRMERQARHCAIVMMEGATDLRRFEKFLEMEEVASVNCWGKSKLLAAAKKLNDAQVPGFVGLVDADFDRILGNLSDAKNVIHSDSHDFDLDAFRTDVFIRYLAEMGDDQLCDALGDRNSILEKIAAGIRILSATKLANVKRRISAKTTDLNWAAAFDGLIMNRERFVFILLKKEELDRRIVEETLKLISEEEGNDLWQLTNGHDFATALGISLQTRIGKRKHHQTTSDEIERHIRLALSDSDFCTMGIFGALVDWEKSSGYKLLKRHLRN